MKVIRGLVPARFLVMMSHLIIVITIFISLDSTVTACLPASSLDAQFSSERTTLIVALSLTLVMFLIELVGFIIGFSMFNASQSLLCILYFFIIKLYFKQGCATFVTVGPKTIIMMRSWAFI
uniref:Transmembrane protein 107 n=1 Tax=Phallusia mammillata TaxID=59560 RepID=A0A6F9DVG5_9ASCI|nr:transmembrane protein 107-like [Phallusia mammillata]